MARVSALCQAAPLPCRPLRGDEFILVCVDLHSADEAVRTADRIRAEIALPIAIDDHADSISASVGIGVWQPGMTADQLVQEADRAMYEEKHRVIEVPEARTPNRDQQGARHS